MNLGNSLKKLGIEQTFKYVYKDPEPNMRKLMDWADRFAGDYFPGQRKVIREAIENPKHPYHDYILHLFRAMSLSLPKSTDYPIPGWSVFKCTST